MAKKNPFVFTIGFNAKDPDHVQVANMLNEQGKGNIAAFIVRAVLSYEGVSKSNLDLKFFESMIKEIVEEQLATRTAKQPETESRSEAPSEAPTSLDRSAQMNILNGLAGFRKNNS